MSQKPKPHIVILGAGFGGIYSFLHLRTYLSAKEADITIINRTNYFLFTPLLHEVATGGLAHHQVTESIRAIAHKKGITLHVAEVQKINTKEKTVETSVGVVPYDYLIIATGATTEFYGTPGAAEKTFVLKTLQDAIRIRNQCIDTFEKAVETKDPEMRKKLLTFVLVGGGATSVELAAEMAELFFDTLLKFFCGKIRKEEIKINLVVGEKEVLSSFRKGMRNEAQKVLSKSGVHVRTGVRVTSIDDTGAMLSDGSRIETMNVMWLGGIKPNVPVADVELGNPKARGRIIVDTNLRVKEQQAMYALGDVATFETESIPTHAQAAVQEAPIVARNIISEIRGRQVRAVFQYRPVGDLVSLGQWHAIGYLFNILWTGPLAWFIWRTVYLFKFASWPKRIKIAVDWTIDMFYPRDITRT